MHSLRLLQRLFPSSLSMSNSSLDLMQLLAIGQVDVDVDSKDESSQMPLSYAGV